MRVDLRFAGLNEQAQQRLRMAARLLEAHQLAVTVNDWDGTRCDLLVAGAQDLYGQRTLEIARRRSTPTLALTNGPPGEEGFTRLIPEDSPVLTLVQEIRGVLPTRAASPEIPPEPPTNMAGLCLLATAPHLQGKDIEATIAGRTVSLRPSAGRALAQTAADLLVIRDHFTVGGWDFRVGRGPETEEKRASVSLDSFYIQGALAGKDRLPPFPAGRYALKDWPDLGSAPEVINALRVTNLLLKGPVSPQDIASACQIDARDVSAYLWAFSASGLLDAVAPPPSAEAAAPRAQADSQLNTGLLGKLAVRFGLIKRQN